MIPVGTALARILADLPAMPAEMVPASACHGRILAADLSARLDSPPMTVSAMDGYAVRAADLTALPRQLPVSQTIAAGQLPAHPLAPGDAARIFTGAPLPDGADAVIVQEAVTRSGTGPPRILVREAVASGAFVRPAGLDFKRGDIGLRAGRRLTARDLGLAAGMNHPWLPVRRRPQVAILATGDEIALPGDPIPPAGLVSSAGPALAGLVRAAGGRPVLLGVAGDSRESLAMAAAAASGADMLVTTGGASTGDHDLVHQTLGEMGLKVAFWKVAMRPGKPLMFGFMGRQPMLGLPGNPVSGLVCGQIFLRPALERMLGRSDRPGQARSALLGAPLPANDRRQDYLRATLDAAADQASVATPFPKQDSAMFATLARADCLIVRPPHAPAAPAGATVPVLHLDDGI